jgi:hypothetical protein
MFAALIVGFLALACGFLCLSIIVFFLARSARERGEQLDDVTLRVGVVEALVEKLAHRLVIAFACLFTSGTAAAAQPMSDAWVLAWQDARRLSASEAYDSRWLFFDGPNAKLRTRDWISSQGLVNGLTTSRRVLLFPMILADGTVRRTWHDMQPLDWDQLVLVRVNLHAMKQSRQQWDKLGDPRLENQFHNYASLYFEASEGYQAGDYLVPATAEWISEPLGVEGVDPNRFKQYRDAVAGLLKVTGNARCPILNARNFVWQAAIQEDRVAGYYTWLGIKDQKSFEELVRFDPKFAPIRDAVVSGVANELRVIERNDHGVWYTYDQTVPGVGNRNPLRQLDPAKFVYSAIEAYGFLPNGFRATALFNDKGQTQNAAPDKVGYNKWTQTNNGRIEVYFACHACHDREAGRASLQPFSGYFRQLASKPGVVAIGANEQRQLDAFAEIYLPSFDKWATIDKQLYAMSVKEALDVEPHEFAEALVGTFYSWDHNVTLEEAALEHGLPVADFVNGLQKAVLQTGRIDFVSANWLKPDHERKAIPRNTFNQSFSQTQSLLRGTPLKIDPYLLAPWYKKK